MILTAFLFWVSLGLAVYVYFGYPLVLMLLRQQRGEKPVALDTGHAPPVTLIVSAFNEEDVIGEKIANSLALDYPADLLEVLVVSDASEDRTDEIVEASDDPRVRLLRMEERGGKTLGLNAAAEAATGEVLVFSDANAMYRADAIRALTRNFADPDVGAVVGESTYSDAANESEESESLYWRYETAIKRLESALGSAVGGDGAIYAIRRDLYQPMRADALSDFVNPCQIVQQGYRCIYEPAAVSVEEAAGTFDKEFRRKVRIVNRAWRAVMSMRSLLNPQKYGQFAFQLISHKLLRWLVMPMLVVTFVTNALLVGEGGIYTLAFFGQLVFYGLALIGASLVGTGPLPRVLFIPYYFCLVNFASLRGIIEAYRGRTYTTWSTSRESQ